MLTQIEREKLRNLCESDMVIQEAMKKNAHFKNLLEKVILSGNINLKNITGMSCLLYVSEYNLPGLVRFFLSHSANLILKTILEIQHYIMQ